MRLIDFFDHGAARNPAAPCLVEDGIRLSYDAVGAFSHRTAWALADAGLPPQSPVAMLTPNNIWGYAALLGLQRGRHIWVPLNARSSGHDHARQMRRTRSRWLFVHSDFLPALPMLRAEVPTLEGVVCLDREDTGVPGIQAWTAAQCGDPFPGPAEDCRHDIFRIASSGGTTGAPKAVVHTHVNTEANMAAFLSQLRYDAPPRFLLCSPMTHGAGSASFHVLALGGAVHLMRTADAARVAAVMEDERISIVPLVPTSLYALLDLPDIGRRDFSALRYLSVGAAPSSPERLRLAIQLFGPVLLQLYSQTECSTLVIAMLPSDYAQIAADPALAPRLQSCGRPSPFATLAVMDAEGRQLGAGERGELVVRSGMVMQGYLDDPDSSAEVSRFGWHHTGDVAWRDDAGYYYIVDRLRDVIISGGFNVFPAEVEQAIATHPAVFDCAVIGVPDPHWGEAVKALVQCRPGMAASEDEIIAWCKGLVGSVQAPKSVEFRTQLPRNSLGKIAKRELRAPDATPGGGAA